jgi:hypothetical protein
MAKRTTVGNVDPALLSRIATLTPGGQRWLKTAIQTMRMMPVGTDNASELPAEPPPQLRRRHPGRTPPEKKRSGPPDMEDIITGKVDIKELDAYPELAEQMEGMGEVIDMLRGLGEARRKRGERILREEILGQPAEERPRDDDEDDDFSF